MNKILITFNETIIMNLFRARFSEEIKHTLLQGLIVKATYGYESLH